MRRMFETVNRQIRIGQLRSDAMELSRRGYPGLAAVASEMADTLLRDIAALEDKNKPEYQRRKGPMRVKADSPATVDSVVGGQRFDGGHMKRFAAALATKPDTRGQIHIDKTRAIGTHVGMRSRLSFQEHLASVGGGS